MKKVAVIVAGGSGSRMQSDIPKQFILMGGQPILMHTIARFYHYDPAIQIILVLPENQIEWWEELCLEYNFVIRVQIVPGGKTRFQSVRNGLNAIESGFKNTFVAIHDGVRPFVSNEVLNRSFEEALIFDNAITCVSLKDSVRLMEGGVSIHVDRSLYRLVQTPQTFRFELIKDFYQEEKGHFTDDASVAEFHGMKIHLTEGNYENIKITTPEDLVIGEAFLRYII